VEPRLPNLAEKENVYLYSASDSEKIDKLLDKTDLYLDINYGWEVDGVFKGLLEKIFLALPFIKHKMGKKDSISFLSKMLILW